jgi:cell division protein FtsL
VTPPAAATAAARHAAPARRAAPAPRPARRVSGPVRPVAVPRPVRRRADQTLGQRALEWLRALPDHRLLDRLIGGRVWIVLLGTLLVGIVTMQLSLLRMNASIGRAVERTSALEHRNAALRLSISQLSDSERIVALATRQGFVVPPQGSPRFLTASAADPAKALTTMRVPDPDAAATAAAQLAASTVEAGVATPTVTSDPAIATATDPATGVTSTTPATTAPATTTTAPATTDPATTATPTSAAGTTAPTTPTPTAAGGASVPVGPQG